MRLKERASQKVRFCANLLWTDLASVCGGDLRGIMQLVEQPSTNEYVRNAALRALVCLVACGEKTRDEVLAYYASLFHGRLVRAPNLVWGGLVACCMELCATAYAYKKDGSIFLF